MRQAKPARLAYFPQSRTPWSQPNLALQDGSLACLKVEPSVSPRQGISHGQMDEEQKQDGAVVDEASLRGPQTPVKAEEASEPIAHNVEALQDRRMPSTWPLIC